jgi:hypothetical protein
VHAIPFPNRDNFICPPLTVILVVIAIFVESSNVSVIEEVALEMNATPIITTTITTKNKICLFFIKPKSDFNFSFLSISIPLIKTTSRTPSYSIE